MYHFDCALSISGVITTAEAEALGKVIDSFTNPGLMGPASEALMNGEREIFYRSSSPINVAPPLPPTFTEAVEKFHISYGLLVTPDGGTTCTYDVVDQELGMVARLPLTESREIDIPALGGDTDLAALAERWEEVDDSPPLHVLTSHHLAIHLFANPGASKRSVEACLNRRVEAAVP